MVYTVTFNPSLDYIISVDDFRLGMTNRTRTEQMLGSNNSVILMILYLPLTLSVCPSASCCILTT